MHGATMQARSAADVARPGTPLHDPGKLAAVLDGVCALTRRRVRPPDGGPPREDTDRRWVAGNDDAWRLTRPMSRRAGPTEW